MTGAAAGTERTLLVPPVALTLATGLAALVVATATVGRPGLLASLVAVGLVLGFLVVGQLPLAHVARGRRGVGAAMLLALYTTRIMLLVVAYAVFSSTDSVDRRALGLTVLACAAAWTAGTVWSALRWRPMVVEPQPDPEDAAGTSHG